MATAMGMSRQDEFTYALPEGAFGGGERRPRRPTIRGQYPRESTDSRRQQKEATECRPSDASTTASTPGGKTPASRSNSKEMPSLSTSKESVKKVMVACQRWLKTSIKVKRRHSKNSAVEQDIESFEAGDADCSTSTCDSSNSDKVSKDGAMSSSSHSSGLKLVLPGVKQREAPSAELGEEPRLVHLPELRDVASQAPRSLQLALDHPSSSSFECFPFFWQLLPRCCSVIGYMAVSAAPDRKFPYVPSRNTWNQRWRKNEQKLEEISNPFCLLDQNSKIPWKLEAVKS